MDDKYHPKKIEPAWQRIWEERGAFRTLQRPERPSFYVLEMFPYPSGKLHMGHVRVYAIGDLLARFQRMRGREVMHPMGWDALGLPAENAAIKDGVHPQERTRRNIEGVKAQMKMLGLSYDWDREIATCDPDYYRWNQWFFLKMLERDLVYRRKSLANWCTGCKTVLANEQVIEGRCERCKSTVVQKEIPDWALRTTRYADELLEGLDRLPKWPERVKTMQRNWIGRSEGCDLVFPVEDDKIEPIRVFTTRADTVYGATYMVLAPEHPGVAALTTEAQRAEVEAFCERMSRVDKAVRTDVDTEKEGVFTGSFAVNPFTEERIPIWIANFVLAEYGTGAVMSVPAHDQRDFEFAKRYGIEIRVVIQPQADDRLEVETMKEAFVEDGVLADSGPHSGMRSAGAREAIGAAAAEAGRGGPAINYHLRDWGVSRQRYWGTPIPIIHCERCGIVPVPYEDLPVELPPEAPLTGTGEPPLAKVASFVQVGCPACGGAARRDTDTMDTFVDSTWYFCRYLDPHAERAPFARQSADTWLPVDIYVGGPEHAVMHLLYFRFWYRVMRDMGLVGGDEPVDKLLTQGMVVRDSYFCPEHGYRALEDVDGRSEGAPRCSQCGAELVVRLEKMSKSKLNGVSPEAVFEQYGADTMRLFCLFAAPPEKDIDWSDEGVNGCYNFLRRLWRFFVRHRARFEVARELDGPVDEKQLADDLVAFHRQLHRCVQKVTRDIEQEYQFNTAIAAMMELLNATRVLDDLPAAEDGDPAAREGLKLLQLCGRKLALMISPFAPHFAEEAWKLVGTGGLASEQAWPDFDPAATQQDVITIAVQVNGKLRAQVEIPREASAEEMEAAARADEKVQKWIRDKTVRRVIAVPGRLVNIVVA
ncbi:MAG: leucine--tRNA ligase [Deltaproteobacteria bacterium]|nr:leucine--tRNA ligase [Deltaproteobacteria bacterium]